MKVKTKLILGEDSDDFQSPVVLPDTPIVRLYIEYVHKTMMHSGVQTTPNRIREHYWVPHGRGISRKVVSKCVVCKRHSNKPVQPDTAPLPLDRRKRVAAFQVTGVPYLGNGPGEKMPGAFSHKKPRPYTNRSYLLYIL
ncbi:integrase_H2C2 domain-containing protein [Trichonephila inaurata madagascariensis]|uniref:Integrase_H2C2 domain-containing protein n=1 Tax=Trichonephila inaurata madagascariensis TaxID=2747483 RepID=A0A8X6YCK7_9ARAC|nr:integrase_H2C2 domain-containing protein [Trichonephila inaurata madagascariensis]